MTKASTGPAFLAVRNFERFQHYKDRSPPWIKLYNALMDDDAFLSLPDAARSHVILIWLLASRRDNKIPNDAKAIARAIQSSSRVDLAALVAGGFLVPYQDASAPLAQAPPNPAQNASAPLAHPVQSASTPLADSPTRARPRPRGEGETETETSSSSAGVIAAAADVVARLASVIDREALVTLVARVPSPLTWIAECRASLDAMPGHIALTPEQLGVALRDYLGNGASANPNLRHFRSYLQRASTPAPTVGTRRPGEAPPAGRAALMFGRIKLLIQARQAPGQREVRFIVRGDVEKLGPDVLVAYDAIGGAERILGATGEQLGFVIRDFTNALEAAEHELAAGVPSSP